MKDQDPLIFKSLEIREKGGLKLALTLPLAFYADVFDETITLKSLRVDLVFSVGGDSILLNGKVDAELGLNCARCDVPLLRAFSDTFDEDYPDSVEYIDTREVIRETVALLAPLKVLCSEACKGRCPFCGIELNKSSCSCSMGKASPFEALKSLNIKKRDDTGRKK